MARGGAGYYWALREMASRGLSEQDASFFCIHVGDAFAIIGLDTSVEGLKHDSDALETRLNDTQVVWLQQRMDECRTSDRRVILLLHHPVLSCGPKYTPPVATVEYEEGVNPFLWAQLSPYFQRGWLLLQSIAYCSLTYHRSRVRRLKLQSLLFPHVSRRLICWGHEHSFRAYQPYTGKDGRTLRRGRLLGHGSKYKPPKTTKVAAIPVEHPHADTGRGVGGAVLDFTERGCVVRYVELGPGSELLENYREEF